MIIITSTVTITYRIKRENPTILWSFGRLGQGGHRDSESLKQAIKNVVVGIGERDFLRSNPVQGILRCKLTLLEQRVRILRGLVR